MEIEKKKKKKWNGTSIFNNETIFSIVHIYMLQRAVWLNTMLNFINFVNNGLEVKDHHVSLSVWVRAIIWHSFYEWIVVRCVYLIHSNSVLSNFHERILCPFECDEKKIRRIRRRYTQTNLAVVCVAISLCDESVFSLVATQFYRCDQLYIFLYTYGCMLSLHICILFFCKMTCDTHTQTRTHAESEQNIAKSFS